jgi:hypothetical protein
MKIILKKLARDEKGAAMVLALVLLLVSGLIAAPLLSHMGSGLLTGEVYETRTTELYAADAGVEDALWGIQEQEFSICPGNPSYNYSIPDVNGKNVDINVTAISYYEDDEGASNLTGTYRIESMAIGDGSRTGIDAYITGVNRYGNYGGLLEQILTSQGEIDVASKVILEYPEGAEPYDYYPDSWPELWELEEFYWDQVEDGTHYDSDTVIDIVGIDTELGPLYVDGTLQILNSSNTPATVTLDGTVYATGDTLIGQNGKDMTFALNGHTVFISSNTTGNQKALVVGGKCVASGPGVFIAVGDIEFKPKSQIGEEEGGGPIFILSIMGTTTLQPSGTVYGAIAGSIEVYVQQGDEPVITYPEGGFGDEDLNFLIGVKVLDYSIASWEVSQQ